MELDIGHKTLRGYICGKRFLKSHDALIGIERLYFLISWHVFGIRVEVDHRAESCIVTCVLFDQPFQVG